MLFCLPGTSFDIFSAIGTRKRIQSAFHTSKTLKVPGTIFLCLMGTIVDIDPILFGPSLVGLSAPRHN
jgi:hypothetical protein